MNGYLLETLLQKGWRRGGEVYWTIEDATKIATDMIRRKAARQVRVLSLTVALEPVIELPPQNGNPR